MKQIKHPSQFTFSRGFYAAALVGALLVCTLTTGQAQYTFTNLWSISISNYTFLSPTDNSLRGVAYNPATHHVLVDSRTGTNGIYILDAENGSLLGALSYDTTVVSGGVSTGPNAAILNLVDCDDEGVIYACNLTTDAAGSTPFKVYRWGNEADSALNVYSGDPSQGDATATNRRFGDSFRVRGSGLNTEIIVTSRSGTIMAILTTADGVNFTAASKIATDAGAGDMGIGLGTSSGTNMVYTKAPSRNLRRMKLDLTSYQGFTSNSTAITPATTTCGAYDAQKNLVVLNDYGNHTIRIYDVSTPGTLPPPAILPFANTNSNTGGTGTSDFGTNTIYSVDSNNGIMATRMVLASSPTINTQPSPLWVLEGGYGSIAVSAVGTAPLVYRWYLNTNTLAASVTNSGVLSFTNIQAASQGAYFVVVSNAGGSVTSSVANVTVLPSVRTSVMSPLWSLAPGSRHYITTGDTQRGLAFNSASNHLILVSRAPTNGIYVLDAATGAELNTLELTGVTGGTFDINMVGVADDGAVYVGNLATGGTGFTIYRWADDAPGTLASAVYTGNPGIGRAGDTFDVRGAGADTQIIVGCNRVAGGGGALTGSNVVIFTTAEGQYFNASSPIEYTAPDGFCRLGLAFGKGNTFWAKSTSRELRECSFDLTAGTGTVLRVLVPEGAVAYTNTSAIGVDAENDLVAMLGILDSPQNLQLYDVLNATDSPRLVDQEFFGVNNANGNGTGSVDFDVKGGRVFALNSNNGIMALRVVSRLHYQVQGGNVSLSWTGPSVLQSASDVAGPYTDVQNATSPYPVAASAPMFFRLRR